MKLTDEQKEQMKMARRADDRINETWSLYTMFLSQDKRPAEALERAQEAVAIWVEWMDNNEIEGPDIERPDFQEQMIGAMTKASEMMKNSATGAPIPFFLAQATVDAEFVPPAAPANPGTDPVQE